MATRAGLSATDMEASRLVFVSVKGAIPRRKVAVPVHDSATMASFLADVATKLRLAEGVGTLYLAATGEVVDRLDTLQDIDELFAEPAGGGARSASGAAAGPRESGTTASFSLGYEDDADPGGAAKYEKRQSAARRALGRLFPALLPAAASLPLTRQDVGGGGPGGGAGGGGRAGLRGRRRSRGGGGGIGDGEDGSSRLALLLLAILAGGLVMGALWVRSSADGGEALATAVRDGAAGAVHAAGGAVAAAEGVVEGAVAAAANQAAVAWAAAGGGGAVAPPPPVVG